MNSFSHLVVCLVIAFSVERATTAAAASAPRERAELLAAIDRLCTCIGAARASGLLPWAMALKNAVTTFMLTCSLRDERWTTRFALMGSATFSLFGQRSGILTQQRAQDMTH